MIDNYPYVGWVFDKKVFDSGKTPVTRLTLTSNRFIPGRNGEPGKTVPHYVTAVAFGRAAEMLATVPEKTVICVIGEPVAGKPYQKRDTGEWVSQLEIKVAKWNYVDVPEGAGRGERRSSEERSADDDTATAGVSTTGRQDAPAYGDDPFQDDF